MLVAASIVAGLRLLAKVSAEVLTALEGGVLGKEVRAAEGGSELERLMPIEEGGVETEEGWALAAAEEGEDGRSLNEWSPWAAEEAADGIDAGVAGVPTDDDDS